MVAAREGEEFRRQLGEVFSRAAEAFGGVRDAVVRSSQVGKLKLDAAFLRRERDGYVRQLGEAILRAAAAGELELPGAVEPILAEIREVERRLAEQEAELAAVAAEAELHREAARTEAERGREVAEAMADDKYERYAAESAPEKKKRGA